MPDSAQTDGGLFAVHRVGDQLRLLRGEIEEALSDGIDDRLTRIHLEDALVRIRNSIGGE